MRFHQNNLLALSATPSKPKIDYTKFVCNFNLSTTRGIFNSGLYYDAYCGVDMIEDVLLDGQPYTNYTALYNKSSINMTGIHVIEVKFKNGFNFYNESFTSSVFGFFPETSTHYSTLYSPCLSLIEFQDNITEVYGEILFQECRNLEHINWNNAKIVASYKNLFEYNTSLKEIDLSKCVNRSDDIWINVADIYDVSGTLIPDDYRNQLTKIVFPFGSEVANLNQLTWASAYTSYPNSLAGTFYYNEEGDYSRLLQYLSPTWTAVPMKFD